MAVKYTKTGLWLEELEDGYRVGLSEKGREDLGEIIFAELPIEGARLQKGDNLLSVEGAKAVTEIAMPMSASVKKIHSKLADQIELINSDDPLDNWIVELNNLSDFDPSQLSDEPWFDEK